MKSEILEVSPTRDPRTVLTSGGHELKVPFGWERLAPGDAAATRRVKAAGPCWVVVERRKGRKYSQGIWAPRETIRKVVAELKTERTDPAYQRRLEAGRVRRAEAEVSYAEDFEAAVRAFLKFAPRYQQLARSMAARIAAHATPVGSGTVARTKRIPLERRAEAATIAWMRHQTTAYDSMSIPRVKGARRDMRRRLAERSREVLAEYRRGGRIDPKSCPLYDALRRGD